MTSTGVLWHILNRIVETVVNPVSTEYREKGGGGRKSLLSLPKEPVTPLLYAN